MIVTSVSSASSASPALLGVLLLATLVTVPLVGLALAAFLRRRSRSYLLVVLALGTLLARTGVAAAAMLGVLGGESHHLFEHALDATMASLVVAAVYYVRASERDARRRPEVER